MSDVMIEAQGLGKKYGDFVALDRAEFQLRRGEILGFIGPNGAGKSTTMKILTCFIAPSSGTASVNGFDIWDSPIEVRRSIGYLPESNPLYDEMLVLEYLRWAAAMRSLRGADAEKRIRTVVEQVGLVDVVGRPIRELSKGYRQRVGLAQALIHEPPILILDEPFSGLDPNQAFEIRDLVKSIGEERSIILSTHNLAEVQRTCQRVLIIDRGTIKADEDLADLELSYQGRYRVSVASGAGGDAEAALLGLPGVAAVHPVGKANGALSFAVHSQPDTDVGSTLAQAASEAGLSVLGLVKDEFNLESLFREVTTRDADVVAADVGGAAAHDDDEDDEDLKAARAEIDEDDDLDDDEDLRDAAADDADDDAGDEPADADDEDEE